MKGWEVKVLNPRILGWKEAWLESWDSSFLTHAKSIYYDSP